MGQVLCPVLVARDEELTALESRLDSARDGRGGCVAITGSPGIGKSRLARELGAIASERGFTVVTGRAVPAGASSPYRPIAEALLQLLRHDRVPDDEALAPWLPALSTIVPAVWGDAEPGTEASPAARGEAVVQLLRLAVGPAGLVIVLEDLHWADPDTISVVEYVGDNLSRQNVLCVLTIRDEPHSPALDLVSRQRGRDGATHIPLERLTPEGIEVMVRLCCPGAEGEQIARVREVADGVPLWVEEVLASPGLPRSFSATVRERLDALSADERLVLDCAAILGRDFDWELLPAMSGLSSEIVVDTLTKGVDCLLISASTDSFRFRHALTREAVLDAIFPPRHKELAAAGLAALDDRAGPHLESQWGELAADLAIRCGERERAGLLLIAAGRASLELGALATAADALRRAADLLEGRQGRSVAELALVEALALAGLVDQAASVGLRLITWLGSDTETVEDRIEVHLRLAQAAIGASRWPMARHQLDCVRSLTVDEPAPAVAARIAVAEAEVSLATDDIEGARALAEQALAEAGAPAEVRCQAFEIVGRTVRLRDLSEARSAFERALATADSAKLPLWQLHALHELGTIDLFDHAGTERLLEARRTAGSLGALSTCAVLDLQLSAAYTCRWDLDAADAHANDAVATATRLGLGQVRAKALALLAGTASMRARPEEMETYLDDSRAAAPDDKALEAFAWGSRGLVAVLSANTEEAVRLFRPGMAIYARLPQAEPAAIRALWPLLLASIGDRRTGEAIAEAKRLGVGASSLNKGLIGYAEAIIAGRGGQPRQAEELVAVADRAFRSCEAWRDLARYRAAEHALRDGWGEPRRWLDTAAEGFLGRDLARLAAECRRLAGASEANPWTAFGVTPREADVVRLVAEGLSNKDIAARLNVSARTVEKHLESLLRKTSTRSRTELAVIAAQTPLR